MQETLKGHTPTQIASEDGHICMQECRWQQQTHRKAMWVIQAEVLLQLAHFMGLLPVLVQLVCLCFYSVRQQCKGCEAVQHTLYGGAVEQPALQRPIDNHLLCSSALCSYSQNSHCIKYLTSWFAMVRSCFPCCRRCMKSDKTHRVYHICAKCVCGVIVPGLVLQD